MSYRKKSEKKFGKSNMKTSHHRPKFSTKKIEIQLPEFFLDNSNFKKNNSRQFDESLTILKILSVWPSPNVHLFCLSNELVTEIWMSNADDCLSTFPCWKSLQTNLTVFRNKIVKICACICYNRTLGESRTNTALDLSILSCKGWR